MRPRLVVSNEKGALVKKRILVVDDDQHLLDALQRSLRHQQEAWSITYSSQPQAAWEQLLDAAYDAVVADVSMPGIDGLDLLRRIRQDDRMRALPVVMLTGMDDRGPEGTRVGSRGHRPLDQADRHRAA